ncbi:uncharacterized protein A4U43_C02F1330 [Asparagus officinalis]|uniref:RING-type E3 ubiquitin transferase n=1 Tax=Asparagus officinalis TaxID=4686 RepID=A0A5P1FHN0_ASPOF|nr:uncharacterized protein LOC109829863 [Asparagus officinalis]ONK76927.1 uncharacterized protein A4U43_C02F1330 [Asparagus officinalis]
MSDRSIPRVSMMETLINYIDDNDTSDKKEAEITDKESGLLHAIWQDDSSRLISLTKRKTKRAEGGLDRSDDTLNDHETIDPGTASRLLQLACRLDSVECAKVLVEGDTGAVVQINEMDGSGRTPLQTAAAMHSTKCIDLLLKKNARTDLQSKDGDSLLALEIALSSKRMQVDWHPKDSVEELLILLRERDLSAMRLLAVATKDVSAVAYRRAMKGNIVELAALLLVVADKITASVHIEHCSLNGKKSRTIYESILSEAMSLFEMEKRVQSNQAKYDQDLVPTYQKKRRLLLGEIELIQTFRGAVDNCKKRKDLSPLIQALRIGDEPVAKLLLQAGADTRETDGDGNTVLHLCLKASHFSQNLRLLWLLLQHGAKVSQRNLLGLTPVHVAAEKGNYQALQILLLHAPECVDIASVTQETPLFFAVRNGHLDCTKLLLQSGADCQVINLRRQRPIDLTSSQDIRFILNPANQEFLFHNRTPQEDYSHGTVCSADNELAELHEPMFARNPQNKECPNKKTEVCRYYDSLSGCVKGANCNFTHGESELRQGPLELMAVSPYRTITKKTVMDRKVFVGGLPLSVDSDYLKEFFQAEFGPVEKAIVITTKAGSQSQSKGFGFVTFKREETVENAVKARFVTIFGKKAEIKCAVMNFFSESYQKDPDGQPLGSLSEHFPLWLVKFRKWLPIFLKRAFKRVENAEGYPLSSLKADFRATCGMELDHTSLGFLKLSDFMRAFPDLCKMRLHPAGNGIGSHIVLYPQTSGRHHELIRSLGDHPSLKAIEISKSLSANEVSEEGPSSNESKAKEKVNIGYLPREEGIQRSNPWGEVVESLQSRLTNTSLTEVGHQISCKKQGGIEGLSQSPAEGSRGALEENQPPSFSLFRRQWDHYALVHGRCTVCFVQPGSLAIIPCHHKLCLSCFKNSIQRTCIICNAKVQGFMFLEDKLPDTRCLPPTSTEFLQ